MPTQLRAIDGNFTSAYRQPAGSWCWARLVLSVLGELEVHTLAGQTLVDLRVGVEAVVDAAALLLVEDDLEDLGVVLLGADALADDLDGVDEVGEDGVVDGGQSPGARALLGLGGAAAVAALGARQDAAGSDDQHVAVGELLLELTGETGGDVSGCSWLTVCWRKKLTAAGNGASPGGGEPGRR